MSLMYSIGLIRCKMNVFDEVNWGTALPGLMGSGSPAILHGLVTELETEDKWRRNLGSPSHLLKAVKSILKGKIYIKGQIPYDSTYMMYPEESNS